MVVKWSFIPCKAEMISLNPFFSRILLNMLNWQDKNKPLINPIRLEENHKIKPLKYEVGLWFFHIYICIYTAKIILSISVIPPSKYFILFSTSLK